MTIPFTQNIILRMEDKKCILEEIFCVIWYSYLRTDVPEDDRRRNGDFT